jgi:hypothetical protein
MLQHSPAIRYFSIASFALLNLLVPEDARG